MKARTAQTAPAWSLTYPSLTLNRSSFTFNISRFRGAKDRDRRRKHQDPPQRHSITRTVLRYFEKNIWFLRRYKCNLIFLEWLLDCFFHYASNSIKNISHSKNAVSNPFKNISHWRLDSKKRKAQDLYNKTYPGMTSLLYFYGTAPPRFLNPNCVKPGYLILYKSAVYRFSQCKQNSFLCLLVLFPVLWFFKP